MAIGPRLPELYTSDGAYATFGQFWNLEEVLQPLLDFTLTELPSQKKKKEKLTQFDGLN